MENYRTKNVPTEEIEGLVQFNRFVKTVKRILGTYLYFECIIRRNF